MNNAKRCQNPKCKKLESEYTLKNWLKTVNSFIEKGTFLFHCNKCLAKHGLSCDTCKRA